MKEGLAYTIEYSIVYLPSGINAEEVGEKKREKRREERRREERKKKRREERGQHCKGQVRELGGRLVGLSNNGLPHEDLRCLLLFKKNDEYRKMFLEPFSHSIGFDS